MAHVPYADDGGLRGVLVGALSERDLQEWSRWDAVRPLEEPWPEDPERLGPVVPALLQQAARGADASGPPGPAASGSAEEGWAVPGVVRAGRAGSRETAGPPADAAALLAAVAQVLAVDPVLVEGPVALERVRLLLESRERLTAAVLDGLRDVEARGLWEHAAAGSTRTWLRSLPCGEDQWLTSCDLLGRRPVLAAALAQGELAERTARATARALDRVRPDTPGDQLLGVLTDGLDALLAPWLGATALRRTPQDEQRYAARRARLDAVRTVALEGLAEGDGPAVPAADRLEPAFALLASALPPGEVAPALGWLVDALLPEELDASEQAQHDARSLDLRRRADGSWDLAGRLTGEAGQLLADLLDHHRPRRDEGAPDQPLPPELAAALAALISEHAGGLAAQPDDASGAPAGGGLAPGGPEPGGLAPGGLAPGGLAPGGLAPGDGTPTDYGGVGPGPVPVPRPAVEVFDGPADPAGDHVRVGRPPRTPPQRRHDALLALLRASSLLPPRPGRPAPARLLVTLPLAVGLSALAPSELLARLPARLQQRGGGRSLGASALARLTCAASLRAVLLDALGRPAHVSHEQRDATPAQRDALRAVWGDRCATLGCGGAGLVPHHVVQHAVSGRTALEDLVPVCACCHDDVHLGKKTLRLRDGRLIAESGWVES